jgi:hypothetical protein
MDPTNSLAVPEPGRADQLGQLVKLTGASVAKLAEQVWLKDSFKKAPELRAAFEGTMQQMRADLAGPNPTALDVLLSERVVMCWLQLSVLDMCAGSDAGFTGDVFGKRQERAQRLYLQAIRTLADIRRLQIPAAAVQVNIGNLLVGDTP